MKFVVVVALLRTAVVAKNADVDAIEEKSVVEVAFLNVLFARAVSVPAEVKLFEVVALLMEAKVAKRLVLEATVANTVVDVPCANVRLPEIATDGAVSVPCTVKFPVVVAFARVVLPVSAVVP